MVAAPAAAAAGPIIDAADLDAATEWAARTSTAVGMPIEVRPFFDSRSG